MEAVKCMHVRIPKAPSKIDVEDVINTVERKFKVNIKSLPQWKELVERLHAVNTNMKQKMHDAQIRKRLIIDKLYREFFVPSPYELTDQMSRTKHKWEATKRSIKEKQSKSSIVLSESEELNFVYSTEKTNEIKQSLPPPNTEESNNDNKDFSVYGSYNTSSSDTLVLKKQNLPPYTCTNEHKKISPPYSVQSSLHMFHTKTTNSNSEYVSKDQTVTYTTLHQKSTSMIAYTPEAVIISRSLDENTLKVYLINRSTETVFIKYSKLSPSEWFKCVTVSPLIDVVLHPGLTAIFTLTYRLKQNEIDFMANLEFKIGHRMTKRPDMEIETLCVPLVSMFTLPVKVSVSEHVIIPPVYPWQIVKLVGSKIFYPTGYLKISVDDDNHYEVTIRLREVEMENAKSLSLHVNVGNSASTSSEEFGKDHDSLTLTDKAVMLKPVKNSLHIAPFILMLVMENVFEPFVFQKTFVALKSKSKISVPVYFTKLEHIGSHQRYYDLNFKYLDANGKEKYFIRTIKIFADVLPNPLQIDPVIMDMSQFPLKHGLCEGAFRIMNLHKIYAFNVKIKLTTKMKRLFSIHPSEVQIQPSTEIPFTVRFCTRDYKYDPGSHSLAHFVIKVTSSSYKPIFGNIPPIYYEIIAPLAFEFRKVYKSKYY